MSPLVVIQYLYVKSKHSRLFERYDTKHEGTISKRDFVKLVDDIERGGRGVHSRRLFGRRFPLERRDLDLSPTSMLRQRLNDSVSRRRTLSLSPHSRMYDHYRERGFFRDSAGARDRFDTGYLRDDRRRYGLNNVHVAPISPVPVGLGAGGASEVSSLHDRMIRQLETKIAHLAQQHENVQMRMLDVQSACESTEQETLELFEPMIERIRMYESRTLAGLQRDQDILKDDADLLEELVDRVRGCAGSYQDLLRLIPTVNDVVARPFKRHFDETTIRVPREALELVESHRESESTTSALRAKDHMIWKLLNERKEDKEQVNLAKTESATISDRSAREISKWKQMCSEIMEKLESCEERMRASEDQALDQRAMLRILAKHFANDKYEQAKDVLKDWQERERRDRDDRVPRRRGEKIETDRRSELRRSGDVGMVTSDPEVASDSGASTHRRPGNRRSNFREEAAYE